MNKKGQESFSIFQFMIVAFLSVIFFASLIWIMGTINDVMTEVGIQNDQVSANNELYVNLTLASEQTFGEVNQSIQALRMVSLIYLLGYAVAIIITSVLSLRHPIWFIINIFISLLAVIFAPTISNAYESLLNSGVMNSILDTFQASNFIILNLPVFVLIIAVLGGIFSFINMIRIKERVDEL